MATTCGFEWTSLTSCCSQLGEVSSSRSRSTGSFAGLSSGSSECFGVRTSLRIVDRNAIRRVPCCSHRPATAASVEHSEVCHLLVLCVW